MISEEVKREEGDRDARASAEFSSSNIESFLVHSMPIIVYDEDGDKMKMKMMMKMKMKMLMLGKTMLILDWAMYGTVLRKRALLDAKYL